MSEALLVPIHVDALVLEADRLVAEPLADFSRLPYVDPRLGREINRDNPNIGETVASQPFQSQNLPLRAGVHLHWAMPDALTRGVHDHNGTRFPALPDRWLITRRRSGERARSWVVESNQLLALPPPSQADGLPYGWQPGGQVDAVATLYRQTDATSPEPFRHMGRQYTLEDWLRRGTEASVAYPPVDRPLTALGCGDIAFAAFYPNCRGIYGFHDDDVAVASAPAGWSYEVVGWHDNEEHDPLRRELLAELIVRSLLRAARSPSDEVRTQAVDGTRHTLVSAFDPALCVDLQTLSSLVDGLVAGDALRGEVGHWLARQAHPTIASALARLAITQLGETLESIDQLVSFSWSLGSVRGYHLPVRTVYVGSMTFALPGAETPDGPPTEVPLRRAEGPVTIALGNTTMEALSAYLARQLAGELGIDLAADDAGRRIERLEDQLESLHLFGKTAHRQLDIGAKFREARHDSGFTPVAGGLRWAIRLQAPHFTVPVTGMAPTPGSSPAHHAPAQRRLALPRRFSELLARLNAQQEALDRAEADVAGRRQQLFADWYKYMLAAYHPPDAVRGGDYPDIDEVRDFIERRDLEPLERALGDIASLRTKCDEQRTLLDEAIARHDASLLVHIHPMPPDAARPFGCPAGVTPAAFAGRLENTFAFTVDPGADAHGNPEFASSLSFNDVPIRPCVRWRPDDHQTGRAFTVSAWVLARPKPKPGDRGPRDRHDGGHDDDGEVGQTLYAMGDLAFCLRPQAAGAAPDGRLAVACTGIEQRIGLIAPDGWHHVALSCGEVDPAGRTPLVVCIDGQATAWTLRAPVATGDALWIGARSAAAQAFRGRMTQIRVDNRALSPFEMRRDMANGARVVHQVYSRAAARYWQPNEPVVLMVGSGIRATERHGQDGRLRDDGALDCVVADSLWEAIHTLRTANADRGQAVASHAAALSAHCFELIGNVPSRAIACRTWTGQPWHPVLLEWEVLVQPARGTESIEGEAYAPDTLVANYDLPDSAVDLHVKRKRQQLAPGAVYSNRCFLTPHAGLLLLGRIAEALKAFLQQLDATVRDFAEAEKNDKLPVDAVRNTHSRRTARWAAAPARPIAAFDDHGALQLSQAYIEALIRWYGDKPSYRGAADAVLSDLPPASQADDPIAIAMGAASLLYDTDGTPLEFLSQSLGGFNDALLMHKRTLQLPVADPLGFPDARALAERVAVVLGEHTHSAPEPANQFSPIRTGVLEVTRLRLVDAFGQVKDFNREAILAQGHEIITPQRLSLQGSPHLAWLPPRLVPPARIGFRWLPAETPDETDEGDQGDQGDPSTPICGWVLPNNLQKSMAVYDHRGRGLGSVLQRRQAVVWAPAPGRNTEAGEIANPHLRHLVAHILAKNDAINFLDDFLTAIESALETIAPESHAQHRSMALLVGRPLAVVRAEVTLELRGPPAVHQGWHAFQADLRRDTREHGGHTEVEFPVRIGEYHQLNDGVVGYWIEQATGAGTGPYPYRSDAGTGGGTFYAPQTPPSQANRSIDHLDIRIHRKNCPVHILQTLDGPPLHTTLLFDPRGTLHLSTGVLPTKVVDIPAEDYAAALEAIEVSFLTAPVLCAHGTRSVPVPDEPGYSWAWLEHERWLSKAELAERLELSTDHGHVSAVWGLLAEAGWIQPAGAVTDRARVVPMGRRRAENLNLGPSFTARQACAFEDRVEAWFWSRFDTSASVIERETFLRHLRALSGVGDEPALQDLWHELITPRLRWLASLPDDPTRARVVPIDERTVQTIDGPGSWQRALEQRSPPPATDTTTEAAALTATWVQRILASEALELTGVDTQARFDLKNEIREGWLVLQRQRSATTE